ncbi:MAG: Gfo/Idh/MocA family oxidoreductase [Xanthomonadales bacterium]|nr:Gfo/Idh/MocA family oxidoreductase [Xanthomonadales bacterium]
MNSTVSGPVRLAMVGGGQGAFIGAVHRAAARLDGAWQLVAGAFSRDPDNCRQTGAELGLDPARCYASWEDLLVGEARMAPDQRAECVAVVTPNHLHFPIARAALEAGFHVMSDKPATRTLEEAEQLSEIVSRGQCLYGLTHTYLGYPMVAEARNLVASGKLGTVRKVYVEYLQGWLSGAAEAQGSKQAKWRTDPARSGAGGAIGDIGTHAFTLAEWVSGQSVVSLAAQLNTFVEGRLVDDDAAALLRFDGGASGVLVSSQVCTGEENGLQIRVYGDRGGLHWKQMDPEVLLYRSADGQARILRAGVDQPLGQLALSRCRTPSGHPQGYIEAFANLYRDFAAAIRAGEQRTAQRVPGIGMGLRGMQFVDGMIDSHAGNGRWVNIQQEDKQ